jgi:hypothetical protein
MQRFKIIYLSFILFLFISVYGCSNDFTEQIISINYYSYVVELNEHGKEIKTWIPEKGSIKVDINNDSLKFIDSSTKKQIRITGSYKLIKVK